MPTWTGFQSKSFKTSTETNIRNGGRLIGGLTGGEVSGFVPGLTPTGRSYPMSPQRDP